MGKWQEEVGDDSNVSSRARMDGASNSRVSFIETKINCLESMVESMQEEIG